MRAVRAGAFGMIAAVTGVVAAGCGSGGSHAASGTPTPAILDAAYTSTVSAKTAQFHFTEVIKSASSSGSSNDATITGTGGVDFSNNAVQVTVNSPTGGSVDVLVTGGILYSQVPPADQPQIPGHKPWISINLNSVDEAKVGRSYAQLLATNNDNPAQQLAQLASVSDQVTKVGPATINGQPTTAYKATVDLDKVAAQATAKNGAKAGQAVEQEEQAIGTKTIPVEVWIGSGNRVAQYQTVVPIPPASAGATNGSGSATMTMTLSGYGAAVDTTPPPAGQVADVTSQVVSQIQQSQS